MPFGHRDACPAFTTMDGSEIREIAAWRNALCERQSLAEATLRPGQATALHLHAATEEIYYVLRGRGRVRSGEETREVEPGSCIVHPAGVAHRAWCTGGEPLVFLCACVPAYEHADTELIPTPGPGGGEGGR